MALIKYPEYGKEISDLAKACPSCGCPVNSDQVDETESVRIVQTRGLGTQLRTMHNLKEHRILRMVFKDPRRIAADLPAYHS